MPLGTDRQIVSQAFAETMQHIALADLSPLRPVTETVRRTRKYSQIAGSVREIGVVEPLVVAPDRRSEGKYLVLDGHLRLEVLKELGETETLCLIATDDEAFTYNKRINRLAICLRVHRRIALQLRLEDYGTRKGKLDALGLR